MKERPISHAIYNSLCEVIPGGVNSPVRSCAGLIHPPMVIESAFQDMVYDADGFSYIDYCGSWGALIHGHAHPNILEAVQKRMAKGTSFGITTSIEEQLARKIVNLVDSVEKIRFVSSGTEATMSAVRLARGYTQRDLIVKFIGNYHGHADFFLVQAGSGVAKLSSTSSSAGIPDDIIKQTICLPYNDINACLELFENKAFSQKIAAVILEPIAGNMGVVPATSAFIKMLREETQRIGAVLIFDEVMTGFRVGLKGAQGIYQVKPDLSCYAKIIGGGFPAAAFGGQKEIMDCLAPLGQVYQAGTLSGNPVAMEAGLQALKMVEQKDFYIELEKKTALLTHPIKEFIKKKNLPICLQQVGSMFTLFFGQREVQNMEDAKKLDLAQFTRFFQFMYNKGIYIPPSQFEAWFVSAAHQDKHLKQTSESIIEFLSSC